LEKQQHANPLHYLSDFGGPRTDFIPGWTGESDLLTFFLCSYAQAKDYGDTLSYNWVCAGWNGGPCVQQVTV
jgi:hypothetical protein